MLEPTGPLPTTVYWRRRAIALAALVVVLLLLIWLIASLADDDRPAAAEPPPPSTSTEAPTTTPPPTSTPVPTTTAQTATSPLPASGQPTPIPTSQPPPAPPPGPPQPCPDAAVAIAAQTAKPEYRVGSKPEFRLVATNTGPQPCTRDLDASLQELLVFAADGTTRLWSSNDCYPGDSDNVRVLEPGKPVTFPVVWAGRTSQPQCAGRRVTVQAGDYLVVAKLGPLTSQPTPFKLR